MDENKMREVQKKVIAKAVKDPNFKKKLLNNPKAAIKEVADIELPENITILTTENTPNRCTIVIPYINQTQDITDEELEKIGGGSSYTCD